MKPELRCAHLQGRASASASAVAMGLAALASAVGGGGDSDPRVNAGLFQEFCSRDVNE